MLTLIFDCEIARRQEGDGIRVLIIFLTLTREFKYRLNETNETGLGGRRMSCGKSPNP
jgi:hypothetical protein